LLYGSAGASERDAQSSPPPRPAAAPQMATPAASPAPAPPLSPLEAVERDAIAAAKRQRASAKRTADTLRETAAILRRCRAGELTAAAAREALTQLNPLATVREDHRVLHGAVSKVGKAVDRAFEEAPELDRLCDPTAGDGESPEGRGGGGEGRGGEGGGGHDLW
jgi:hypothetical protein